jgi:N-acetylneuraminic acid mutarotase
MAVLAAAGALAAALIAPVSAAAAQRTPQSLGPPNTWVPAGQMSIARSGQTATLLPGGKVLVTGGGSAAAELYDPSTRTFSPAGHLPAAVTNATATLLKNGMVLVAGGLQGSRQVTAAELYDPAAGMWSPTGPMNVARSGQTATLLPNGEVLVAGGGCNGSGFGCNSGSFEATLNSAELYNPATGTWQLTGKMAIGREFHTATLLPDGLVLVAGGFVDCDDSFCSDTRTAELYDPATGKWTPTGSMNAAREQHSATLLQDGKVLVAGGIDQGGFGNAHSHSSAELYDPKTGIWSPTASMSMIHIGQTATLLPNGWVLVAGGGTSVAEIYEPQRALWVSPGAMGTARTHQTATLLPSGFVLVTGGGGPDGAPLASAEMFLAGAGPLVTVTPGSITFGAQQVGTSSSPQAFTLANVGSANLAVSGVQVTGAHPADFRPFTGCGKAALAPGAKCTVSARFAPTATGLRTAALTVSDNAPGNAQSVVVSGYGGGPNTWVPVGSMTTPRDEFAATLLPDGKVLVAGGETVITNPVASAELYDPATRRFSATGSLNTARAAAAAVLLPNGQVLVAGGRGANFAPLSSAELYDPATGTWASTTPMNAAGSALTATLLPDGSVLVTGLGGSAEVYNPAAATWTNTGPMVTAHGFATTTLLPGGKVLVAGGGTTAAELYDPGTNQWTATGSLNVARQAHTATLLPDGQVLVAGGVAPNGGATLASAELYNPATGTWKLTGSLITSRAGHTAILLSNGDVMVAGGCSGAGGCNGNFPALSSTEFFDAQYGYWYAAPSMIQPRVFQSATLLASGDLLMTGGDKAYAAPGTVTAELYTPNLLFANPRSGPAGQQVTLTGSGFYAGETVKLTWDFGQLLGRVTTSAAGTFTAKVTIPAASPGQHTLTASGRRSFAGATAGFTVTG